MNAAFHVQGRLIERRGPVVVRDEARRVDTDSRDEAFRIAAVLRGDGFTVWVWAVDPRTTPAVWDLVERIDPPRPTPGGQHTPGVRRGTAQRARAGPAGRFEERRCLAPEWKHRSTCGTLRPDEDDSDCHPQVRCGGS